MSERSIKNTGRIKSLILKCREVRGHRYGI